MNMIVGEALKSGRKNHAFKVISTCLVATFASLSPQWIMAILLYICCLYVFSYFFLVKSLQVAGKYCFDPLGGYHYNGADLVLWSSCKAPRRQFVFLDIGKLKLIYRTKNEVFHKGFLQ